MRIVFDHEIACLRAHIYILGAIVAAITTATIAIVSFDRHSYAKKCSILCSSLLAQPQDGETESYECLLSTFESLVKTTTFMLQWFFFTHSNTLFIRMRLHDEEKNRTRKKNDAIICTRNCRVSLVTKTYIDLLSSGQTKTLIYKTKPLKARPNDLWQFDCRDSKMEHCTRIL